MAQRMTKEEEAELERQENLAAARKAGHKAFRQKQFEWASQWFTTAIELQPNDYKLHAVRSQCFLRLGKYQLCIGDANIMISLKRKSPQGYHRKGVCHLKLQQYARAYRTFQDGLAIDPQSAPLLQGQQDVLRILQSGKGTVPGSQALLFSYYDSDANTSRGDRARVPLDVPNATVDAELADSVGVGIAAESDAELAACAADMSAMANTMRDRRINVYGQISGPVASGSRDDTMAYLRLYFDMDPIHAHYIVYYTGRGTVGTGDWCMSSPRLGLADVLAMWRVSAANAAASRLVIVADCPYSGAWVTSLRDSPEFADLGNVAVQASTLESQVAAATADGGVFTQTWLDAMSLNVDRRLVSVGTTPTPINGLEQVQPGRFASDVAVRPALLISSWINSLQELMALVQTPCAHAQWAMPDEVVIHCGRRFQLLNVESARHIHTLHDLDIDDDDDDDFMPGVDAGAPSGAAAPPECRVA